MAEELLLYTEIQDWTVSEMIDEINEYADEAIKLRINCTGGDPIAVYGLCAKIQEHGNVNIVVDGCADSAAFYLTLFGKTVECLDVSTFGIHRAAFRPWVTPTEEDNTHLANVNSNLKKMCEAKFDAAKFKRIVGCSIDDMFDMEKDRVTVVINAEQAKKLGVVQKINKLTPSQLEAFNRRYAIAAKMDEEENFPTNHTMTKEEFAQKNPAGYAEIVKEGAQAERNRIEAYMVFADVDIKAVKEGIESGASMTGKMMAELSRKMMSGQGLAAIAADSAGAIETPEADGKKATEEEKAKAAEKAEFEASFNKQMGFK